MTHNHWSDSYPYLVPMWHSMSQRNPRLNSANCVDPNLGIDFGGIGIFNDTSHKRYRRLIYKINKPALPFYIDPLRLNSPQAGWNCLAYASKRQILFSCQRNRIRAINVDFDEKRIEDTQDVNTNSSCQFSDDQHAQRNPFCFNMNNIWNTKINDNILNMRAIESDFDLELMTHSSNSLKIFKIYEERDEGSQLLRLVNNINSSSALFPCEDSLLDHWDRNDCMPEDILSTFILDNTVYRWNIEDGTRYTETKLDVDSTDNTNNLIGVNWAKSLNPFLYFYGTHNEIYLGDIRQNGSQQSSRLIHNSTQHICYNKAELFQSFVPNLMEPHQLITSSDFNISIIDLRFPNKNIFQFKHMFSMFLTNKLYSQLVNLNNQKHLLLISSNSERASLHTLDTKSCIQPIMMHASFCLNLQRDINDLYPSLESSKSFIRGIQILPGKSYFDESSEDFFSIASLLNSGDIYMQDFWASSETPPSHNVGNALNEFKMEKEYGNPSYFWNEIDESTKIYMDSINNFAIEMKQSGNGLQTSEISSMNHYDKSRESLNSLAPDYSDTLEADMSSLSGSSSERRDCSTFQIEEETSLLDDELESVTSMNECKVLDGNIGWTDQDLINFKLIKDNWLSLPSIPDRGIRNICHDLTISVCEKWFDTINSRLKETEENEHIHLQS